MCFGLGEPDDLEMGGKLGHYFPFVGWRISPFLVDCYLHFSNPFLLPFSVIPISVGAYLKIMI